ncbi:hypothetical protein [Helicobacter cinaedi]|uniref:hypothetical protein n=1 Tax=Helicobacter cinaedi TaxID=213 RepID=UPI000ACBF951|nr:hypothetical protein [Helicobacter cinaedi]BBB19754.1 hypothetical protein HC081234_09310 [Helicobacter cinaedi]
MSYSSQVLLRLSTLCPLTRGQGSLIQPLNQSPFVFYAIASFFVLALPFGAYMAYALSFV